MLEGRDDCVVGCQRLVRLCDGVAVGGQHEVGVGHNRRGQGIVGGLLVSQLAVDAGQGKLRVRQVGFHLDGLHQPGDALIDLAQD